MAGTIGQPIEAALQPPADVNPGDHSEAMLRKLDNFKRMMAADRLGFLYKRWRDHPCADPGRKGQWAGQPVYGEGHQEREDNGSGLLWQLKIINWGLMYGTQGRLANLHKAADALAGASDQVYQKIHAAWTSKAGDMAAAKFVDLRTGARDYSDQLQKLSAHIAGARTATRQAVEKLATFAERDDAGGKPLMSKYGAEGNSDDHGNEVRGDWSSRIDAIDMALRNGTYAKGMEAKEVIPDGGDPFAMGNGKTEQTPQSIRSPDQCYIEANGDNMWSDQICSWLDDLCHCYYLTIANFRRCVEETEQAVQSAWELLNRESGFIGTADPFGKLTLSAAPAGEKPKDAPPKDTRTSSGSQDGTGGGQPRTGGGGQVTDTGGGTPKSAPVSTPMPEPVTPPPMPDPTTPSQSVDPGTADPGTGDVPGGPADPTRDAQRPDVVTIEDGDHKISVQSPDGQGHVKVTVDDGSGQPKTYDLDFGPATGQQSTPGTPGANPGTGPVQSGPDGPVQTLPAPAPGQPGVDGQPPGQDGGVQHVKAGPDGKVVLHDGDVTITAERPPGAPDQVRITVDDGTGNPTSYLIDPADPAGAQVLPANQAGGGASGFAGTGVPVHGRPEPSIAYDGPGPQGSAVAAAPGQPEPAIAYTDDVPQGAAVAAAPGQVEPAVAYARDVPQGATGQAGFVEPQPAPADQPAASSVWSEPVQSTSTQSVGFAFGDDADSGGGTWSTHGDLLAGPDVSEVAPAGEAGLAAVPDEHVGQPMQGASGAMGGMPMMGGMGAAGGSGGGDQERGSSTWSTQGDLFDDGPLETGAERISSVLSDDNR